MRAGGAESEEPAVRTGEDDRRAADLEAAEAILWKAGERRDLYEVRRAVLERGVVDADAAAVGHLGAAL